MTDRLPTTGWRLTDLPDPGPDAPTVVSTFSCGGGSSMGYKRAGFRVEGAVDIDPKMMSLYQKNLGPVPHFTGPIGDRDSMRDLIDRWKGLDLDIFDGSPPCTSFSTAGVRERDWGVERFFQEGQAVQVLDQLFFDYLDLMAELQPKIFIAENVTGMLKGNAKGYVVKVAQVAREYGYDLQIFNLNAARYGVPQQRQRVFFVGRRRELNLPKVALPPERLGDQVSVREAWDGLSHECAEGQCSHALNPATKIYDVWKRNRPGQSGKEYNIGRGSGEGGFNSVKVAWETPTRTIASSGAIVHPQEPRKPTRAEILRLGSFPDDYQIAETQTQYVVGMSVPPVLAEEVARTALRSIRA